MVNSSSRPASSAARSATSSTSSGVAHARCGLRLSLRPVLRPRLRGRTAGLKGISGGFALAASPRMVCSRLRASFAVLRDTCSLAGSLCSHTVISSPVSELSCLLPQYGRRNRRIRYSRLAVVLGPTSCMVFQRSIHSLTVISPAAGSVHAPARTFASWSRPQASAACLVSKPDWLASPLGILYLTRHGLGPLPRFSAYAIFPLLPPGGLALRLRPGPGSPGLDGCHRRVPR